jgi:hypothetical protein
MLVEGVKCALLHILVVMSMQYVVQKHTAAITFFSYVHFWGFLEKLSCN